MPLSLIANKSPSTIVIPVPSVMPSMLRTASTLPNSSALAPELTLRTCPAEPMLSAAPMPPCVRGIKSPD